MSSENVENTSPLYLKSKEFDDYITLHNLSMLTTYVRSERMHWHCSSAIITALLENQSKYFILNTGLHDNVPWLVYHDPECNRFPTENSITCQKFNFYMWDQSNNT